MSRKKRKTLIKKRKTLIKKIKQLSPNKTKKLNRLIRRIYKRTLKKNN